MSDPSGPGRLRLVIVDAEDGAAGDLEHLLTGTPFAVERFEGSDLERHLAQDPPFACLIATALDGEGLARVDALREGSRAAGVRLLVTTADVPRETLALHARSISAADAYLRKPWDEARVKACLERLQQGAPSPDERLLWLDERTTAPDDPGATSSGSGSPVGIPPLFKL